MKFAINIFDGPLPPAPPWRLDDAGAGAGAVLRFEGIVRPDEHGRAISALDYEIYPPMTGRQLHRLAAAMFDAHDILALRMAHSRGRVPVGRCSFRLEIAAAHRQPALAAMEAFIDRMKREVPIWKLPVWAQVDAGVQAAAHGERS